MDGRGRRGGGRHGVGKGIGSAFKHEIDRPYGRTAEPSVGIKVFLETAGAVFAKRLAIWIAPDFAEAVWFKSDHCLGNRSLDGSKDSSALNDAARRGVALRMPEWRQSSAFVRSVLRMISILAL